jgi:hypothetical protein
MARLRTIATAALACGLLTGSLLTVGISAAHADTPPGSAGVSAAELTGNTLAWPDGKGGTNLIHFGRFGEFDRYVPCQFESGAWQLGADRVLHLQYVNPQLAPRDYVLSRDGSAVTLAAPDGETFVAELQEGDRLPYY